MGAEPAVESADIACTLQKKRGETTTLGCRPILGNGNGPIVSKLCEAWKVITTERLIRCKVVVPIMGHVRISLPYSLQFLIKKPKLYMLNYHY